MDVAELTVIEPNPYIGWALMVLVATWSIVKLRESFRRDRD